MQTLTALTAISNPPVLEESSTFRGDASALNNLNNRQLMAIRVLSKMYHLADAGGTNYKSNIPLMMDSTAALFGIAFNVTVSPYEDSPMNKWETVLDWNAAKAADSSLPTDVEALLVLCRVLVKYPENTLYQVLMLLRYKLSLLGI